MKEWQNQMVIYHYFKPLLREELTLLPTVFGF